MVIKKQKFFDRLYKTLRFIKLKDKTKLTFRLSCYIYYLVCRHYLMIRNYNNVCLMAKCIQNIKVRPVLKKIKITQLANIYYALVQIDERLNCFDYAVLFSLILAQKRRSVKLCFGVINKNATIEGHAWVELSEKKIIDFTGAYMFCKKTFEVNMSE